MSTPIPTAENPIIINLEPTYGALLAGCFISCAIWGMSTLQFFWYLYNYENESLIRMTFVLILWCFDTARQILILTPMWPVLITRWGRVAGLFEIREALVQQAWISGIVAASVQIFYLYRIYCYNGGKWFILVIIGIIALYQPIMTIPYIVILHQNYVFSTLGSNRLKPFSISVRAVSALVDIFIASVMSYYLLKQGRPKFTNTRRMIIRLMVLTINTGIWTAVFAIADMFLVIMKYDDLYYVIFEWPLVPLYLSVLLVNLNSREYVRGQMHTNVWSNSSRGEIELGNVSSAHSFRASSSRSLTSRPDGAFVINMEASSLPTIIKAKLRE